MWIHLLKEVTCRCCVLHFSVCMFRDAIDLLLQQWQHMVDVLLWSFSQTLLVPIMYTLVTHLILRVQLHAILDIPTVPKGFRTSSIVGRNRSLWLVDWTVRRPQGLVDHARRQQYRTSTAWSRLAHILGHIAMDLLWRQPVHNGTLINANCHLSFNNMPQKSWTAVWPLSI